MGETRGIEPRVLRVDLTALRAGESAAARLEHGPAEPRLARIAAWSGPAAALAVLAERARERDAARARDVPFVVAVGDAVRRALPTAARASVLARAPLTGRLAQGQVGGEFARAIVASADVLVVEGRTELLGAVLVVGPGGRVTLRSFPELAGASPAATHEQLVERLGPCATLRVGPAAERGVRYANLASGASPQSFVGRGGLGAALAERGLKAIAVLVADEGEGEGEREGEGDGEERIEHAHEHGGAQRAYDVRDEHDELVRRLRASPRLRARSSGGTLELAHALAARERGGASAALGVGPTHESAPEVGQAREDWERAAGEIARGRQGCRGCPTPCGWVLDGAHGEARGARFAALDPLGPALGLRSLDDALVLLEACDCVGVDAKEAGASLAVLERARERGLRAGARSRGDVRALAAELATLGEGSDGAASDLALGASALARRFGLEHEVALAAGEAARADDDLAALLGACAGARGAEPMRSFPWSSVAGMSRARLARLVAPLALPRCAEDPRDPAGKGRLVWWHESFATAVDATGFCAFSAAGLLADGLADLDELARWIAPWSSDRTLGATPGRALLAAGASLVTLQIEIDERLGAPRRRSSPAAERELARPGMREEYERARGIAGGALDRALLIDLASERVLERAEALFAREADAGDAGAGDADGGDADGGNAGAGDADGGDADGGDADAGDADGGEGGGPPRTSARATALDPALARGVVRVASHGPLAALLGGEARIELALPASVRALLGETARRFPAAAPSLARDGELLPAVYRRGERLAPDDLVRAGDRVELVLVIAGG